MDMPKLASISVLFKSPRIRECTVLRFNVDGEYAFTYWVAEPKDYVAVRIYHFFPQPL